ncbi:MAG: hypothetical protein JNJ57_16080 [Saprospiraceae bacterium]|nr:hypothetical protein [Saprospiraceae bacterium]
MNAVKRPFSFKTLSLIIFLTILVGIGAYAVAWQFNDGKMGLKVIGSVFLGMSLPSLLMGGVLRLFRPDLQRYFAITGLTCLFIGLVIILS